MTDLSSFAFTFAEIRAGLRRGVSPSDLVAESCRRAAAAANDGVFTALVDPADATHRAKQLEQRAARGEQLPLLGLTFAVKDNIHVAGMATTSNCPGLHIMPDATAVAVEKLESAGAVLIGKNTMDQFATGLNGTRTPEPLCRNAIDPRYIPGGSSSGSAVAVARHIVAFSLGSDTGGSGRVPAACNGIVGLKPTIGLVSTRGLLFNSRILDCIPVFANCTQDAYETLETIAGYDEDDPLSRDDADRITLKTPSTPGSRRLAMPRRSELKFCNDRHAADAFDTNIAHLVREGFVVDEVDFGLFEQAGRLVFQSALVAERLSDYADVIANRRDSIHPAVWAAIEPGLSYSAKDAFEVMYELKRLRRLARGRLEGFSALVVPTVPTIYTIDDMLAEPMRRNALMGTYTYFVNPLDFCAVSVPGVSRNDGLPSALSFVGLAAADGSVRAVAEAFEAAVTRAVPAAARQREAHLERR